MLIFFGLVQPVDIVLETFSLILVFERLFCSSKIRGIFVSCHNRKLESLALLIELLRHDENCWIVRRIKIGFSRCKPVSAINHLFYIQVETSCLKVRSLYSRYDVCGRCVINIRSVQKITICICFIGLKTVGNFGDQNFTRRIPVYVQLVDDSETLFGTLYARNSD